jgi:hypothetical protein
LSERAAEYDDGEYEEGRPLGLYILVGVVIALVAVSGLFAIGFIPPVAKIGGHGTGTGTSTRTSGTIQFITVTSTYAGPTTTVSVPGQNTTLTSSTVLTTTQTSTATSTQTSTQTLTSVSTATSVSTIFQPTTTTTTITNTTTTTVAPTSPLSINVTLNPPANPATLYPGELFTISVSVYNTIPLTNLSLDAYQLAPGSTPLVTSFYPLLPESVAPVLGNSFYTIQGFITQAAPVGVYQIYVEVAGYSLTGTTILGVSQQYLVSLVEPLTFGAYHLNATANFNGTCTPSVLPVNGLTDWNFSCGISAAPMAVGNMTFAVTNAADVPICIQTSLDSGTMTGFVNMNPYPFCPDGSPGVYVRASTTNFVFTYTLENGATAGNQTVFFTFARSAP